MTCLLLLTTLLLLMSGCAPIAPWQRGRLARRCMRADVRGEEQRARQHMLGARESSQGAVGETGGGCGCN
jgi:hypothetical protein